MAKPLVPGKPDSPGSPGQPVNPGKPPTPGKPIRPELPPVVNDRVQFVPRDQVLAHLQHMPKETDGLLVVSPIGQDDPDDFAQLAMHVNPDFAFKGSMTFLINTRASDNSYDVLDLNNLPAGVEVQITIKSDTWTQSSHFRGTEGNIQGGGA